MYAAEKCMLEVVKVLLTNAPKIMGEVDNEGKPALYYAVCATFKDSKNYFVDNNTKLECVKLLISEVEVASREVIKQMCI